MEIEPEKYKRNNISKEAAAGNVDGAAVGEGVDDEPQEFQEIPEEPEENTTEN